MKKSLFATLLLAITTSFSAYSFNPTPPVIARTKLIKEKVISIQLANLEKKYTYVSITDMQGELIYFSQGVKNHNGFKKAVNLTNLSNGKYLLKVKTKGKILRQILQVKGEHVYLSDFK